MAVEYRVCWTASSNISFRGATPWRDGADWGEDAEEIEDALSGGALAIEGLEIALDASGFEWTVETRETNSAN